MIKCIGICGKCGKCENTAMMSGANERKTKMLTYPKDFRPETGKKGLGAAFDIGTTTVVGMLWDLEQGEQIAACGRTNPQNEFGMDVISRIAYCGQQAGNLVALQRKIIDCLNEIIKELCEKAGAQRSEIVKITACGNTTMAHLFAGYSPETLAFVPFAPAYTGALEWTVAKDGLGSRVNPAAELSVAEAGSVVLLPNIAGHVGGDITAGLAASRFLEKDGLTLFIDIGTNGEIALADGVRRYACSTAAGPAFEGAAIRHGMRAAAGAIERVRIKDGEVFFKTIGQQPAQGICGSGLIDAMAQMLKNGLIKKSGRLISAGDVDKAGLDPKFKNRLVMAEKERQFILAWRENNEGIVITQSDIREVQLAKGAIVAGIKLLLDEAGKAACDIREVMVAGAFGNYIDRESAVTIGLLPDIEGDRIHFIGNAAGCGVSMALTSDKELEIMKKIPELVEHVELAGKEDFQKAYMEAMQF